MNMSVMNETSIQNDLECKNGQQNRDLNPDPIQRGERAVSQGLVVMLIIMESNIC